jgi:hypothetical protein
MGAFGADSFEKSQIRPLSVPNPATRAFSGKVESGFPSENPTTQKMLERFLLPTSVKALLGSNRAGSPGVLKDRRFILVLYCARDESRSEFGIAIVAGLDVESEQSRGAHPQVLWGKTHRGRSFGVQGSILIDRRVWKELNKWAHGRFSSLPSPTDEQRLAPTG